LPSPHMLQVQHCSREMARDTARDTPTTTKVYLQRRRGCRMRGGVQPD
jgi:hypothetical protein